MKKQDNKQWELIVKFITKIYCSGKLVKESTRDSEKYIFYGDTKKECIEKAKKAGRYGNFYTKNFNLIDQF